MNKATIKAAIKGKIGANIRVSWTRPVKLLAKWKGLPLTKTTTMIVRIGCGFDNLKKVKADRKTGELPPQNTGLKGMHWDEYPIFVVGNNSGKTHLRMSRVNSSKFGKTTVEYHIDGQKVNKEDWAHTMQACETKVKKDPPIVFNVNIEQITLVHRTEVEKVKEETPLVPTPF